MQKDLFLFRSKAEAINECLFAVSIYHTKAFNGIAEEWFLDRIQKLTQD
jgi:hypothetical protein